MAARQLNVSDQAADSFINSSAPGRVSPTEIGEGPISPRCHKMKIFLCTTSTSKHYKSWSNIPYLLHKHLQTRGYEVKNIVLRELFPINFLFNLPIRFLIKCLGLETTYFFVRTPVHFFFTYIYSQFIRFISSNKDIMLVQGYSYPPHNSKNRLILLGDWPSAYLFDTFLKRRPSRLEMRSIAREDRVIENANAVITLFPDVHKYMHQRYKNRNIFYFGNVVNIDSYVELPPDILDRKRNSRSLLFIGQPYYLSGAHQLIDAVDVLRKEGYDLLVDIVGIEPSLIGRDFDWLSVHGYLDKGNAIAKRKYYELLANAKLFVNTTAGWTAFQAMLEAMYFFNPIVVRCNPNLVQTFPGAHTFSYFVEDQEDSLQAKLVDSLLFSDEYLSRCRMAHEAAKPFTWVNFTDQLVKVIGYE